MESINPATGERIQQFPTLDPAAIERAIAETAAAAAWQATSFAERAQILRNAAVELRAHATDHARLITLEMGKLIKFEQYIRSSPR
ncbi:MAG: aldehyde dehydrogenase family protein [Gammaproteobacteria bacterium]|nr:aldehyde dehydrogenase family protein [Gammaproteobacteria bacterium]